jgi:hypothetical protein
MKKTMMAAVVAAGLALADPAAALDIGSTKFDDTVKLGNATLVANGGGIRTKVFFKVYAMALYLPEKKADAEAAITSPGNKRVAITLLRDLSAQQFVDALQAGVAANHSETEMAALKERLGQFSAMMAKVGEAKEGTQVVLDWLPDSGTRLSVGGKAMGDIAGEDFYRALLRVWLGKAPAQDDLKAGLLGK